MKQVMTGLLACFLLSPAQAGEPVKKGEGVSTAASARGIKDTSKPEPAPSGVVARHGTRTADSTPGHDNGE